MWKYRREFCIWPLWDRPPKQGLARVACTQRQDLEIEGDLLHLSPIEEASWLRGGGNVEI